MLKNFLPKNIFHVREWFAANDEEAALRQKIRRIENELYETSDRELMELGITRWEIPQVARQTVRYGR